MSLTVKIGPTPEEADELFRLRHRIFAGCGYIDPASHARLEDRWDDLPTTANVLVVRRGRVVAGVRFAERSAEGSPADGYFDFGPHLPREATAVGSVSMLVVEPRCLRVPRLLSGMLAMGFHWARRRGLTHVVAPVAPDCEPLATHVGFRRVAPRFRHESLGLLVSPMLLEMDRLDESMVEALEHHERLPFSSFEWQLFRGGETIPEDAGRGACVVVRGRISVEGDCGSPADASLLGPGDVLAPPSRSAGRPALARTLTDVDLVAVRMPLPPAVQPAVRTIAANCAN